MTTIRRATIEIDDVTLPDGKRGRLTIRAGGQDAGGIVLLKIYGKPITYTAALEELAAYIYGEEAENDQI